jgi:hypothetical protein
MWIARDKDGQLTLFTNKPHRCTDVGWDNESWDVVSMDEFTDMMILNPTLFPNLTWKNEPIEVELTLKKKD